MRIIIALARELFIESFVSYFLQRICNEERIILIPQGKTTLLYVSLPGLKHFSIWAPRLASLSTRLAGFPPFPLMSHAAVFLYTKMENSLLYVSIMSGGAGYR